jgi:hypothetical protein
MIITKTSPMTGMINTMDVSVTEVQIARWQGGMLIQDAMPDLSVDEREFIMTGMTPADWEKMV